MGKLGIIAISRALLRELTPAQVTQISGKMLASALMLPPTVEEVAVQVDHMTGNVLLKVRGDGLPDECEVGDGEPIRRLMVRYATEGDETQFAGFEVLPRMSLAKEADQPANTIPVGSIAAMYATRNS